MIKRLLSIVIFSPLILIISCSIPSSEEIEFRGNFSLLNWAKIPHQDIVIASWIDGDTLTYHQINQQKQQETLRLALIDAPRNSSNN